MTNSEMLRLAAKAAGISLEDRAWNPLRDDGDCFRLMVALGIEVKRYQRDSFHLYVSHPEIESAVVAAAGKDAIEGMRLAVVQVAVKLYHHRNDCRIELSSD